MPPYLPTYFSVAYKTICKFTNFTKTVLFERRTTGIFACHIHQLEKIGQTTKNKRNTES